VTNEHEMYSQHVYNKLWELEILNYQKLYAHLMGTLSKICDMTKDATTYLDEEIFNIAYVAMNRCEQEILEQEAKV